MGLREEIEAAFGAAAAEGGVRVLAVDGDEKLSSRQVDPDEPDAAARTALKAFGIGPGDPLLIHLRD